MYIHSQVIDMEYANEAYKRMEKGDVKVCMISFDNFAAS